STGLLSLRLPAVSGMPEGGGGILRRLIGNLLNQGFGAVGGNLFLLALLLVSITLPTGLSWLAVVESIGGWALSLPTVFRRSTKQAVEWQEARAHREERQEVRKADSELRAKREKVKIEPPPAPVVEKSERAKREQQIPMFVGVNAGGSELPALSLLDPP